MHALGENTHGYFGLHKLATFLSFISRLSMIVRVDVVMNGTTAPVFETSVPVNNRPIQDYVHSYDHAQPTHEMTPAFKPFTVF